MDNDIYGHVNNVVYYSYFDTVINRFLIDARRARPAGAAPWSAWRSRPAAASTARWPSPTLVHAGLRVGKLGTSSVRYEIGIFRNDEATACADGHFVHVFVDRASQRPVPIPEPIRTRWSACRSADRD